NDYIPRSAKRRTMVSGILSQLHAHQADVKAALARVRALIDAESLDMPATAEARRDFTRSLTGYQIFKHQRIFDPLARHGSPADSAIARQLKFECVAMGETFRPYLARWNASGIHGREAEYRREARGIRPKNRFNARGLIARVSIKG